MLLAPSEAKAHLFDATIPGTKMTLEQCFQLADKQNLTLQAGRKSIERAKVMEGTAWDVDKTEIAFGQNPASSGDYHHRSQWALYFCSITLGKSHRQETH